MRRQRLAERRKARGYSQEAFAQALDVDRTTVQRWERGDGEPQPWQRPRIAKLLDVGLSGLDALLVTDNPWLGGRPSAHDDELEALELLRRVQASDVGQETLDQLERVFDELAIAYPVTPPHELLQRVRQHAGYVARLIDGRTTLAERRRLLVLGGWFSLLGATLHIDVKQEHAATARLNTALSLARHAEHREIEAWCHETSAWRVLTDGDYRRALELSLMAQSAAPSGSSVAIQATAQEGRARARLGQSREVYDAISRVQDLSAALPTTGRPEHHYRYDPAKAIAYTATTLAWAGDSAAEGYAREVIARLSPAGDVSRWPRRVASANIDLALVLLANDRLDEACDAAQRAILSGRIVPSNHWRALEIVRAAESRHLPEAAALRDAYQEMKAR